MSSPLPLSSILSCLFTETPADAHNRGGSLAKLRIFLTVSTCLLYLVAAGLVARSVWYFEAQHWKILVGGDAAEMGSGPGSYDIDRSVWHVNVSPRSRASRGLILPPGER